MPKKQPTKKTKAKRPPIKVTNERSKPKKTAYKLPTALSLSKDSFKILWENKKTISLIVLIYGIAYLILVLGISGPSSASSLKSEFHNIANGHVRVLYSGVGIFSSLLGSSTSSTTSSGSAYQVLIVIMASLAIIWSLRMLYNKEKFRARDAFYKGLYPLAAYLLVLLFLCLELVPLIIGLSLYVLLFDGNIAVTAIEKFFSLIIILGLVSLSLYFVTSNYFAIYIVTLNDMTPMKAIRSARKIVKKRKLLVFRKLLFLPVLIIIIAVILIIPFAAISPVLAAWVLFVICMFALTYIHSYCYLLYRGLINE